jgi:hypothetical protein
MRGILPLKAILHDRHIGTSGICPVCNGEAEDLLHMIFKYQGASSIWKELGLDNIVSHAMIAGLGCFGRFNLCAPGFSSGV